MITQVKNKRPMTASSFDIDSQVLDYPVIASEKIDGVRMFVHDGVGYSRSLKPLPNKSLQRFIHENSESLEGLDGELIVGDDPTKEGVFNETSSAVRSVNSDSYFIFFVFDDRSNPNLPYKDRLDSVMCRTVDYKPVFSRNVELEYCTSVYIQNKEELLNYLNKALTKGFEGVMIRDPKGPYKFGRSTLREKLLLKIKPFEDSEGIIIGFEEMFHNENDPTTSPIGTQVRSTHKNNMKPSGMLGNLIVNLPEFRVPVKVGSGLTQSLRKEIWDNINTYLGKYVKIRYTTFGAKKTDISCLNSPRHPVFLGFREEFDMEKE